MRVARTRTHRHDADSLPPRRCVAPRPRRTATAHRAARSSLVRLPRRRPARHHRQRPRRRPVPARQVRLRDARPRRPAATARSDERPSGSRGRCCRCPTRSGRRTPRDMAGEVASPPTRRSACAARPAVDLAGRDAGAEVRRRRSARDRRGGDRRRPVPVAVTLPVTINGRIFPREDVDVWTFAAKKGQRVTLRGPRRPARLAARRRAWRSATPTASVVAENDDAAAGDPSLRFTAARRRHVPACASTTASAAAARRYVYRLTVSDGPYVERVYPLGGKRGDRRASRSRPANLPHRRRSR